jgi:CRISPR-associated protein Cas2
VARRRYLIAYDIAEPRRLRRICSIMESFGERLQYSVFLCDLSVPELLALYYSHGFTICDRAAAQREVVFSGCRLHGVTSFRLGWVRWLR